MNRRFFVLLILLPCVLVSSSCSDSTKERAASLLGKVIAPEGYEFYESTLALIDYVNAKTKMEDDCLFLHSKDSFLKWEEEMDKRFQDFEPQYDFDALMNRIVKVCQHPLWDYGDFVDNDYFKLMKFLDQVADQKTPLTIEKEGKYVYSGVYFCARRDRPVVFVHPFSANVQKGVVTQFYSETDGSKVTAIDLLTGAIESKNQYEWRVTKQKVKTTFMDIIEGLFGE